MEQPKVSRTDEKGICFLTLDHPSKRNALSHAMLMSLSEKLQQVAKDKAVRVVILRSEGPVFCAGHDLREITAGSPEDHQRLFGLCTQVMRFLPQLPQPVIAQVQGLATAAGCQLVASCDLVVASETASFATPGVKIGLFCTTPGVALARAIHPRKALEMLFTGDAINALEAQRLGLVNQIVPADKLAEQTRTLALRIANSSRVTMQLGKRAFHEQIGMPRAEAYALAESIMADNACMPDAKEGMSAFLEKRTPNWLN